MTRPKPGPTAYLVGVRSRNVIMDERSEEALERLQASQERAGRTLSASEVLRALLQDPRAGEALERARGRAVERETQELAEAMVDEDGP